MKSASQRFSDSYFADRPLLSAELHYFRVPRGDWELMLARIRQLGANTISTYAPWSWHEPRRGSLDLDGRTHPQRDLAGFVRLCGALGFRVILEPGPFVDAKLLGDGIPPWLLHNHPEIHALRADGQPWRHSASGLARASCLHPTYLAAARGWIAAFSATTRPLQAPAGPVVALRADNTTPGDGMSPADEGLDRRSKLDYNPYVIQTLWPQWLAESLASDPLSAAAEQPLLQKDNGQSTDPPSTLEDLKRYADLDVFADWLYTTAVATVAGWLREDGWTAPIFHALPGAPWQAEGTIADLAGLAHTTGWLAGSVQAEDAREPFVGGGSHRLSFEEYVHYAHWRTRLLKQLSPGYPSFIPAISAAQDFYFAAPFVGGAQGANISMATQTAPDNRAVGAWPRRAMEALIQPDSSVRPRFWNAKVPFTLLGLGGADFAAARAPASLALGYSHVPERVGNRARAPELAEALTGCDHALRSQLIAQQLVRAGVAFDVLDLDAASPEELARYALLVIPATAVLARATQAKLARGANLALLGDARTRYDERLELCDILENPESSVISSPLSVEGSGQQIMDDRQATDDSPVHSLTRSPVHLPENITGEQLGELVEQRDGTARYAWADREDVDVCVRHGAESTYVFVANRRGALYNGTLAYRGPAGDVMHLHIGIGGPRVGMTMLRDDEVVGAAVGGDGAQGGWHVRGARTSILFNSGAGVVAPCGDGLLLSAPQSGTFQVRRPAGWDGLVAWRLLLSGALLPAASQSEAAHISVPYIAEDECGQTDLYLVLPPDSALPEALGDHFGTLLAARAAMLRRAAARASEALPGLAGASAEAHAACERGAASFERAAADLERLASGAYTLEAYGVAWDAAVAACGPHLEALAMALAGVRGAFAAGTLEQAGYEALEQPLTAILGVAARAGLEYDREW